MPIFDPTKCPVPSLAALPSTSLISDCSIPAAPPPILDCPNLPIPVPPFPGPPGKDGIDGVDGQPGSPGPCPQLQAEAKVTGQMSPLPRITIDVQNADGADGCGYCTWVWVGGGWAQISDCLNPDCTCNEPPWPASAPPTGTTQVTPCTTDNCNKKFTFTFDFPGQDLWGECCAWCWDGAKWTKKWGPEPGACPSPSINGDYCGQIEISCPCSDCGAPRCEDCLCTEGDRFLHLSGCTCLDGVCMKMTSADGKVWTGQLLNTCGTTIDGKITRLRKKTSGGLPDKITVTLAVSGVPGGDGCENDSVSVDLTRTDPASGCSYYEGSAVLNCGSCSDTFQIRVECGTADSTKWQVKIIKGAGSPNWASPDWTSTEVAADDDCLTLSNTALTNSGSNNYSLTFCSGGSGTLSVSVAPAAGYGCDCWKLELTCSSVTLTAYEDTTYDGCNYRLGPYIRFKETTTPAGFCCSGSIIGTFNCTDCAVKCCDDNCTGSAPDTIGARIIVGAGDGDCAQECATGALSKVPDPDFCLAYDGTVTITCNPSGCQTTIPVKMRCVDPVNGNLWEIRVYAAGSSGNTWDDYVWTSNDVSPDDNCVKFSQETVNTHNPPPQVTLCDGFVYPLYLAIGPTNTYNCPTQCCGDNCAAGLPDSVTARLQVTTATAGDPCENVCNDATLVRKTGVDGCSYYEGTVAVACGECGDQFQLRLECSDAANDKWVLKIIKGTGTPDWTNPDWTSTAVAASDGCLSLSNSALTNSGSNKYTVAICETSASASVDLEVDIDAVCAGSGDSGGSGGGCCGCGTDPSTLYIHYTDPNTNTAQCVALPATSPDCGGGCGDYTSTTTGKLCGNDVYFHVWCFWSINNTYNLGIDIGDKDASGCVQEQYGTSSLPRTSCSPLKFTGTFRPTSCPTDVTFTVDTTPC